MPQLTLHLLGAPGIARDGAPVAVDTRKATALLAYLAVTGRSHARETLAALLWPEYDDEHARAALRRTLSTLRAALGAATPDHRSGDSQPDPRRGLLGGCDRVPRAACCLPDARPCRRRCLSRVPGTPR